MSPTKVVWKYPLELKDEQIIEMPANARMLCVQMQGETPSLWVLVDPYKAHESRKILIAGTGHEREALAGFLTYIGSFQMMGGQLVYHVFESVIYGAIVDATELVEAAVPSNA
jgi:hypothetical protein